MPFRVEGDRAFGPGVFDMKASLILADFAIDALRKLGLRPARPVDLLLTSDEEIGSPTSRALIEDRARQSAYVLVLEPPLPDGSLKTARKGVGHFVIEVEGRPAHAGVEIQKGISAIEELARLILRLHALTDLASGVSVNVGRDRGGDDPERRRRPGLGPRRRPGPDAGAGRDDRGGHPVDPHDPPRGPPDHPGRLQPAADGADPGVAAPLRAGPVPRPVDRAGAGRGLDRRRLRRQLHGRPRRPDPRRPRLPGGGAHADHEQIELDSFPERAALLALLLMDL